jgi:hypothetical protein
MRLVFDRGTVLIVEPSKGIDLSQMPGLLWDPRVDGYRAPAYRHKELASELVRRGVRHSDGSLKPGIDATVPFSLVLRAA